MSAKLGIGMESFEEIREIGAYYVDKTELIFDLLENFPPAYKNENYYHAFLTGLLTGMGYAVKSNQENGLGRTDIDIREKKKRRAMIIEAKKSASAEDMEEDALAGVKQIVAREYLKGFEGYKSVLGYGVAFYKKMALVKKLC